MTWLAGGGLYYLNPLCQDPEYAWICLNKVRNMHELPLSNILRILTGKNHRQVKLRRLQKVQIWAFELLLKQINSFLEVIKLKQNFQKNKLVTGKTPFFVTEPFSSHHFICLNIGFRYGNFVWKWCAFNLSAFN